MCYYVDNINQGLQQLVVTQAIGSISYDNTVLWLLRQDVLDTISKNRPTRGKKELEHFARLAYTRKGVHP